MLIVNKVVVMVSLHMRHLCKSQHSGMFVIAQEKQLSACCFFSTNPKLRTTHLDLPLNVFLDYTIFYRKSVKEQ